GLSPRSSAVLLACRDNEVCAAAVVCALLEEEQARAEGDLRRALELLLKNPHAQGREAVLSQAALMLARRARLLGQGQPAGRAAPGAGVLAAEALRVLADPFACGRLLLPGHADRLVLRGARARDRDMDTGHMRQGQGVLLPPAPDADTRFLLALETMLADTARAAGQSLAFGTVGLHCPVAEKDALAALGDRIVHERVCEVQESGSVLLREVTRLDALVLEERRAAPEAADGEVIRRALCGHVLAGSLACLPWTDAIERWLARLRFAAGALGDPWPVLDRATLAARQEEWLPGLLEGVTGLRAVTSDRLFQALRALVPWQCLAGLAEMAPDQWTSPAGRTHPVRYDEEQPCCEVKLQECFGLGSTPLLCGKVPLTLHLLSPGGARLASTRDLPFFWKEVYPSVRSEMRGRYPRHPWPEDPLTALPTALTQKALRARGLA
ncbi:MAG: ATP-dependent helicase C-terminal domain-containing protein, partial [Desulfovibrionaceae bacterium]|nr:ATP-dependent helicase C-terminal domain-containing protein [Desulfovibrionaceae bacterium]